MTVPAGGQAGEVRWHDLECGAYVADLPLWRELADAALGPVLDIGAGTGRVALELARAGHPVTALERNPALLAALRDRSGQLPVTTVLADARDFRLDQRFALCIAPMQTVQLLGGPQGRAGFLRCARRHLHDGGTLAAALADPLEGIEDESAGLPLPDVEQHEGWLYSSQPVAVRRRPGGAEIHRVRQTVAPDGAREQTTDVVRLDELSAAGLEGEAAAAGLRPLPRRHISPSREHVGSTVVMLCA